MPHRQTPLFGVDFFARLFERVFCPHPSLTALFQKCPMSANNSANISSNTHTPGSLTWSLTSLLHTLIHPHRSSHSLLPASFYVISSKFGVLPAIKVIYTLCNPGSPCTLRFTQILLSVHSNSPHPTCKYPFIGRYHLYNTVHYIKKSLCCYVQVAPGIHSRICPLS